MTAGHRALRALPGQVREVSARDALSVALKDDDADVRAYARRALAFEVS